MDLKDYTFDELLIEKGETLRQLATRPGPIETEYLTKRLTQLKDEVNRRAGIKVGVEQ